MFIINDIVFRNLEEQVQENKEQIAKHWNVDRVLADFGIKMLGRFDSYDDIKDLDEGENYGNAYLIGTEEPYDVYVWTRPDVNAGQPVAYWLDIGPISLVGPQGPEGPQGEKGEAGESPRFFAQNNTPSSSKPGDVWLKPNGDVLTRTAGGWYGTTVNIRGSQGSTGPQGERGPTGPAGPQGIQGEQGPAGGFINIFGILENTNQLPTPSTLNNLTAAYLIKHTVEGQEDHYHLYIQVGETASTATWNDAGPFNLGTLIFSNGNPVETFDADTKLNKYTANGANHVYVAFANGSQGTVVLTSNAATAASLTSGQAVPTYFSPSTSQGSESLVPSGVLLTGTPKQPYHAASKKYVDDAIANIGGGGSGGGTMYRHWIRIVCSGHPLETSLISSKPADQITVQDFNDSLQDWCLYPGFFRVDGSTGLNGSARYVCEYYSMGPSGSPSMYLTRLESEASGYDISLPTSLEVLRTQTL